MFFASALLLGFVAGLRSMMAPAAASWAAYLGLHPLSGTPLAFMGLKHVPGVLSLLALAELVNDKLPRTPSRKIPPQFIARLVTGTLAGACMGAAAGSLVVGLLAGAVGAVGGIYGGSVLRARLSAMFGKDWPAALLEDALAIVLSIVAVTVV